jgi:acetoin utilization deacetylase AcuC-like enzyme
MLCIYYNESETKNKNHFENHDRINVSVKHIKENIKNITMYNNNDILNYLQSELKMGTKEEISKLLYNFGKTAIYSDKYMMDIKTKCSKLKDNEIIDNDTYFSNVTYDEILDNSVIMYNVCYQININSIRYAYCLIRPPSHHSSLNQYSGFCIVNHTYLTAKHLHDTYKKKVLILDYDVHHGDGTQKLVNSHITDNIYFISIHCYGDGFYPGTGNTDENNMKVLNIPMKKGSNNKEYIHNFKKVKKFILSHDIDIIVVSNGVDAHVDDPFKTMKLTNKFYCYVTSYLKSLDKPLIYILEGGYNPEIIGSVSVDIINILQTKELKHKWSVEETKNNKLPHIKLNSIKMKYANRVYLAKRNMIGALSNKFHMHKKTRNELCKKECNEPLKNDSKYNIIICLLIILIVMVCVNISIKINYFCS